MESNLAQARAQARAKTSETRTESETSEITKSVPVPIIIAGTLQAGRWTAQLYQTHSNLIPDDQGQLRLFGATCTLQAAENIASSSTGWRELIVQDSPLLDDDITPALQEHLLDHYWRYHHPITHFIEKKAFIQDMEAGRNRYFSKALLYAMFACAGRTSEIPEVRALASTMGEGNMNKEPYLLRKATALAEEEICKPGITTVQCLQLLSVVHSNRSNNTKGWLESGMQH